jgi:hypothetical protein
MRVTKKCNMAGLMACFVVGAWASVGHAADPTVKLTVDFGRPVQTNFLGISGTYGCFNYMKEPLSRGYNEEDRAREYDRLARMGIRLACPHTFPMGWVYKGPRFKGEYTWDSERMTAFCAWVRDMKERGIDVALRQSGWPVDSFGSGWQKNGPTSENLTAYGDYYAELIHYLVVVRGFTNVKYGVMYLEPHLKRERTYPYPPGENEWSWYVKTVKAIDAGLKRRGLRDRIKLVGPNNSKGAVYFAEAVRDLAGTLDAFSGHDYNLPDYRQWHAFFSRMQRLASPTGKPFWIDEGGLQREAYRETGEYGTYVGEMCAAAMNAGSQVFMIWRLFDEHYNQFASRTHDSLYNGVHRWGACYWPRDSVPEPTNCRPWYYAFSLITRLFNGGPGTRVFTTSGGRDVHISAAQWPDGQRSILVVNASPASRDIVVSTGGRIEAPLHRYLYDPACITPTPAARLIRHSRTFPEGVERIEDQLPPRAVAVYSTIDLGQGSKPESPTAVAAQALDAMRIKLTWRVPAQPRRAIWIERRIDKGGFRRVKLSPDGHGEWIDHVAMSDAEHVYRVVAASNDGIAARSADVTVRTPAAKPRLVGHWKFNNDNGHDYSGNELNARLDGVKFTADAHEGSHALAFGGGRASADCGVINVGSRFTFAAWVKIPAGAKSIQCLLANSIGGHTADGFRLAVNSWQTSDGCIGLETGNGADSQRAATPPGVFEFDKWQHVALTVDRGAGRAAFFVNGQDVNGQSAIRSDFAYNSRLTIGSMHNGHAMQGDLDDVRLYNYILSRKDITALAGKEQ